MTIARLLRQAKRPHGLWVKMATVAVMGLCFIFVWSMFSSSSTSVTTQRESFDEIRAPAPPAKNTRSATTTSSNSKTQSFAHKHESSRKNDKGRVKSGSGPKKDEKRANGSVSVPASKHESGRKGNKREPVNVKRGKDGTKKSGSGAVEVNHVEDESVSEESEKEEEEVNEVADGKEQEDEAGEGEGEGANESEWNRDSDTNGDENLTEVVDQEPVEKAADVKKQKIKGPVFDSKARYSWKLCNARSKQNYIPCIDVESGMGKLQSYRHSERSCPRAPTMCLVPLPHEGYEIPVQWPDSKLKIFYKNVARPKLAAYVKKSTWMVQSGEYLNFPQNQSEFNGGVHHYLESIEEMVPDIEWGKNVRVVLDIGCTDSSFGASLLDKDVLTLSLGLKDDLVDLAQVALERGFPAIISPFASRRLPFPSGVFDAMHCGECSIPWHSHGGKLLLELNRILRPGGYFILSTKHDTIEEEEAMATLTASICWNILAHKTDEESDVGVKIYQKPDSNDIYELRRKKNPPLCTEKENPDAAWHVPMKTCLNAIPSSIEQHGTEWPEQWSKRLETYPDWANDKEKLSADTNHWKAIVDNSYLTGLGIDWSSVRNIMDMKAINGGFAAALSQKKVWVMNVVPVHAPDTLPFIFERGLFGVYHDWCESFGTYPRSYDLLHADHLFSRLKNRCKQPVSIVVEMDRILRPGGWAIIRDRVDMIAPLEQILRSMHWEIRMTFAQDREGLMCAQKTDWRP